MTGDDERDPRTTQASRAEDCLDAEVLARLIAGDLPAAEVEAVLVHVDACPACAEVMANLARLDAPGAGRYQLGRVLGAGGMGIVYEAWDPQLRRRVALKRVRPELTANADAASRERMWREARALARVSHPHVVAVYDVSEHAGELCVATELVDGETLATWQVGRSIAAIAGAWLQAARGLAAAHAGGVIHRDVKPANVFVGRDGRVRVGDFGLAQLGGEAPIDEVGLAHGTPGDGRLTASGFIAGTPAYMAPEQARGEVDARSDQFALCVALGEAVTGARPAADSTPAVASPALAAVIARGVRTDPDARFPSMAAFADALEAALAPPRRRGKIAIVGAIAAVIVVGLGVWLAPPTAAPCAPLRAADLPPARRAQLARVLPAGTLDRVDAWRTAWDTAASEVCTVGRSDDAVRAQRDRCLTEAMISLDSLLARWDAGDARDLTATRTLVEDLPRVARCSHLMQRSVALAGVSRGQALALVPLEARRQLAFAQPAQASLAALTALAADAQTIGYAPLTVDVIVELAARTREPARATALLREAIATADTGHAELAGALARVALIGRLGADPAHEAPALADHVRATLDALGDEPVITAALDLALGKISAERHQYDRAVPLFERAIRGFRTAYGPSSLHEANAQLDLMGALAGLEPNGAPARAARDAAVAMFREAGVTLPMLDVIGTIGGDPDGLIREAAQAVATARAAGGDSPDTAEAELDLAAAYVIADRSPPALEHYLRGAAINDRLGVHSGRQADALGQIAALLREAGRAPEAVVYGKRAVAFAAQIADDSTLGSALTGLGDAQLAVHDLAGARESLSRALAIRDRLHEPARFRGHTRFLLASALWPREPARAKDLAHAARVDLQSFLDSLDPSDPGTAFLRRDKAAEITRIDRWLASHP